MLQNLTIKSKQGTILFPNYLRVNYWPDVQRHKMCSQVFPNIWSFIYITINSYQNEENNIDS
jgi:hypothetical protein